MAERSLKLVNQKHRLNGVFITELRSRKASAPYSCTRRSISISKPTITTLTIPPALHLSRLIGMTDTRNAAVAYIFLLHRFRRFRLIPKQSDLLLVRWT